jgi:hypothetical protein
MSDLDNHLKELFEKISSLCYKQQDLDNELWILQNQLNELKRITSLLLLK